MREYATNVMSPLICRDFLLNRKGKRPPNAPNVITADDLGYMCAKPSGEAVLIVKLNMSILLSGATNFQVQYRWSDYIIKKWFSILR